MTVLEWVLIGVILILLYINAEKGKKGKDIKFKIIPPKKPVKENHLAPIYYGYSGGFTDLNTCSECSLTGLYEDIHAANACPSCGGKVHNSQSGYWGEIDGEQQWITKSQHEKIQAESNTK